MGGKQFTSRIGIVKNRMVSAMKIREMKTIL
jgi:hypothetical protein